MCGGEGSALQRRDHEAVRWRAATQATETKPAIEAVGGVAGNASVPGHTPSTGVTPAPGGLLPRVLLIG